ncbi:porin family protein [Exilibacterium tricleocarpae]|uniref:porin family protein n=1 Tax=Exilibacterium tricleocarpae TaxID=2591008 RepID=UPI0015D360AD|nr:porin family protein [Exilibacterium tricleocarpae]
MNNFRKTLWASGLLVLTSSMAQAEAPEFYVGGGYGLYKFEFDNDDIDTDFEDEQGVIKLFAGGKFTEHLGVELAYLNFDEATDSDLDADIDGFSLAAVLSAPLGESFSLFGKLGWFAWEADISGSVPFDLDVIGVDDKLDGDDVFYGVGAKFRLTDNVDLRVEYDRYELDDNFDPELDIFSVSAQFVF